MVLIPQINESLLNISSQGGLTYLEAKEYVTIQSCHAAMAQVNFWMYVLGVLFLIAWFLFCYTLYRYIKLKKLYNSMHDYTKP